ncbi:DNA-directed RNA polymerase [Operophtera brumata]|uniref:DNA-directed RNA polymerase n=1 Tax=Operophtera brumata TaxID=104452 RepID=A0A0L7KZM6_OPEBR|nr:DNA-directed RNA polymerase [Operophtera brumata]
MSRDSVFATRYQSTKTVSAVRSPRKKKYKSYKKYGELLEVGGQAMTETKVSISKLRAVHLSKLASSSVSLGQLHQLTTKPMKKASDVEVDPELLKTVREKILNKFSPPVINQQQLEDDKCALVFTTHQISNLEDRIRTKQYLEMAKESYYNFRRATLYDQRLQDLRYAINEGLTQEFDLDNASAELEDGSVNPIPRSPHAVFRELFVDNQLDSYDQELMTHITNMQAQGISHPAIEDIYDDSGLHHEITGTRDELEFGVDAMIWFPDLIDSKQAAIKQKKKVMREKRRAVRESNMKQDIKAMERRGKQDALHRLLAAHLQLLCSLNMIHEVTTVDSFTKRRAVRESNMKQDIKAMERRGKQDALHRLLAAHLQLLCSLNMIHEGRRIVQYYRQKGAKVPDHPRVTDIKVYNALLHGYASMGLLQNATEVFSFMSEDKIEPNAQTFAAIFECIERKGLVSIEEMVRKGQEQLEIEIKGEIEEDQFVNLIMGEISKLVDGSETYSPTLKLLQRDLGTHVYHKYQIEQCRRNGVLDKMSSVYAQYCEWYMKRGGDMNSRQAWQNLMHRCRDGASLVMHRPWGRLVRLELKPHPVLARLWSGAAKPELRMRASLAPTRGPPAPWTGVNFGAMPMFVMNQWKRLEDSPPEQLYPALDSLNQLGEVPSGGNKKLDIPPPSSTLDTSRFDGNAFKRRLAISRARGEMHSLWCDMLYKLSLANHFR